MIEDMRDLQSPERGGTKQIRSPVSYTHLDVYKRQGYCDYIHENGLHGGYVFANQEEYFESIWEISFTVKDGVITHIGIGSETL